MKRLTKLLTLAWAFLLIATMGAYAQSTITVGSQVTAESDIVSGQPYVLYYQGNNKSGYCKVSGTELLAAENDATPTEASIFYFISAGNGTWNIKSQWNGYYLPGFTAASSTYVLTSSASSAGAFALNFQSNNTIAPSNNGFSFNRSSGKLHGWTLGTAYANQLVIYRVENTALPVGSQVTAESSIDASTPYVFQYVGNNAAYVQDQTTSYSVNTSNASLISSAFFFSDASNSGTIRNLYTGRYFPSVSSTAFLASTDDASAGNFELNMSDGIAYPTSSDNYYLSRSSNKLQGWASNSNSNFKIYSVGHSTTALSSFVNLDITVSSEAATSLSVGTWYVMYNRGRSGYLYEDTSSGTLYNTSAAPSGYAPTHANYLVRIVHSTTEGKYYLQNGLGNYFAAFTDNTAVSTSAFASEEVSIGTIASTAGHFYLTSSTNGIVLDCQQNGNPVVGYGTTIPTSVDGNNDWAFYPVTLDASWTPTASEVYTVNNTNTNRGALMYYPTESEKYIWSSGKSGTFDETDANCQWVFYPTGTDDQYYLYNVGADKFAVPSGIAQSNANSWYFSPDAVAVTLENNGDGTYKIKMAVDPVSGTNAAYMGVSNSFTGPIINWNDAGSNFTITQVSGADQSAAVAAAVAKLVNQQTALTSYPQSSGWYVLQIKSKTGSASYANRYLYQASSLYSDLYPLTFTGGVAVEPAITDPTFFTYIDHTSWDVNTWQLPDGRYLVDNGSNKFPTLSTTAGNVIAGYSDGNYFKTSNNYYADPYNNSNNYYIGETTSMRTAYTVYPIDLTTAGLTAWQVIINNSSSSTMLTCTRSDVVGNTSVYTGGWFFLPTGTTPTISDFSLDGMLSCTVDDTNYTITAEFDPTICIVADDVTVIQGHQTTGVGNTMQALLRVKATPFSDMTPTSVSVTLTNYDQLDNVAVYVTTDDELHAASASPVQIGQAAVTGASMTITTSSATALTAGTTYYLWITGDVKSTATEWGTIDAAITNIAYSNTAGTNALDVTSIGDPDGVMRIYKQQAFLWTPSNAAGVFYRIPTMITTDDGGIVALADYRHDHPYDLGKSASNGTGSHVIDVVSRRSTDGGLTWQSEVVVAAGDGTNAASYGYGDPAIVKDANGTLHCFMAAGNTSYANGMLHMGYSKSTDGGATWSAVTDIYSSINKSGLDITSAFTTAGTGVTFSNGRMAFAMLGKVSGTTNIYPLYSDDNGDTWTISPTVAYAGGDESKFEIMNDNTLLLSVRKGSYNGTANRSHNQTTSDASGEGISSWGTSADWTDMNANGCNADILYYGRTTDGSQDVLLHTLTKSYGAAGVYRQDLRLYMSLDQGATWSEAFSLQPGSSAYSSMQKLTNGDLAIIFEDGTIGNRDHQDCYAINYVVISKELLEEKISELVEDEIANLAPDVKVVYNNNAPTTYGDFSASSGWRESWTSKVATGYNELAGVTLASSYSGALNQSSNVYSTYVLAVKVSATDATDDITITAPSGYIINSYTLKARSYNSGKNYTLTSGSTTITTGTDSWSTFTVSDINTSSATFTITTDQDQTNYLCITDFVITVVPEDAPTTSTFYLKNVSTGTTLQTKTVPYGTSLSDVLTYTDQGGSLSPLVSYDLQYDFSANTYTANYTVETTDVTSSPAWYYARLRGTKFMSYDPMAEVLSGYGHPVTNQMTTFGNEYLWAFEGDPYVSVKIYNKAVGTTSPLTSSTKTDGEQLHFVENGTTTFIPAAYNGGLVFKLNDETVGYLNDVNGGIGRWNSTWGASDGGSTMTFTAEADVEDLVSYVPDAVTNYVSQFFTGNVIGAVGDFANSTAQSNAQTMYQTAVSAGSSVTVADYKQLLTIINGYLVQPTTGNYRLVNVNTGKYLGFNEAFHVRGYTAANGTNANEGYSETGQTLSTVWHVDVNDEGTTAAPVITNSGYYLDAVTSLEGASAGDLVMTAYPLSYAIGVNGAGAIYSSGDNITAAATGNTYNNASNYDHNTTDNGTYRVYATDAARWKLVPATQTDITVTGNVLSGKSYATLYVPFDCTIATENTTAYKLVAENVDDANSRAYLTELATEGEIIPAGTGVVLINTDATTTLTFTPCDDNTTTAPTDNVIYGTYKKVLFDSDDTERTRENTYIFGRGATSGLAGFYQPSASVTKLNANRCYIIPAAGGSTVGFALFFDDSPVTGIGAAGLVPNGVQMPIYDLQGRRVAQPQKGGVYIVNGKKVML